MKNVHTNLASGYRYHGGNALILDTAARKNRWKECQWATRAQAEKLGRPPYPNQKGVIVMLNEKKFTVFNTAQLCLKDNGEGYGEGHPQWESDQLDAHPLSEAYGFGVQMALGEL